MPPENRSNWPEWVIGICVTALSLLAAWIVLGPEFEGLTQLFQR